MGNGMDNPGRSDARQAVAHLLREARAGDSAALGELLTPCSAYLLWIADAKLPGHLRIKVTPLDLVQDTFADAHCCFQQFAGQTREELRGWLRRILLNNIADTKRRYDRTEMRSAAREVSLGEIDPSRQPGSGLAHWIGSPVEQAMFREDRRRLDVALAALPEDYRTAITLRYQDGLTFEEVGSRMERSAEAARKLLMRAIVQLREGLKGPDDEA